MNQAAKTVKSSLSFAIKDADFCAYKNSYIQALFIKLRKINVITEVDNNYLPRFLILSIAIETGIPTSMGM